MKSIVVGTAGHIDHGKTALVKALTGIDADRLAEEKRRGITIDLGFAHTELDASNGETFRVGFVDVPGHERFVSNMLAGVGGIDLVLLVIAANEGVMPQTREHFEILQLLNVQRGLAVLTKSDSVDRETLEVVKLEVEQFLRGTFLDKAESILAVSSLSGEGMDELKRALACAAEKVHSRDTLAIPRLPIDRAFTMKGFGTVVTGTLIAGTIHREEELELFPGCRKVRARGLQVHGLPVDQAIAGQRVAVNLAGAGTHDLSRGMMLSTAGAFLPTRIFDGQLQLLPSPRSLKNRARVHLHSHALETIAEISLFELESEGEATRHFDAEPRRLSPGHARFARFKLAKPALLLPGDRFIIRQLSPVVTIGGGVVLDAVPLPRFQKNRDFLKILDGADCETILTARIARRQHGGITLSQLVSETGWPKNVIEPHLAEGVHKKKLLRMGDVVVHGPSMLGFQQRLVTAVEDFQKKNPLAGGIAKEELRERLTASLATFEAAIDSLVRQQKIELAGEAVRMHGLGVAMNDEEAESKTRIEEAFSSAGLQVPTMNAVLAGLKIDRTRAKKIVTLLLREKALIKVSDDLVFHRTALEQLRGAVKTYKSKASKIDVAQFKALTGVSRKYAIPLFEYLDRERVTRRVGDAREIL